MTAVDVRSFSSRSVRACVPLLCVALSLIGSRTARASTQDVALTAIAPQGTEIRRFDDDASAMQALIAGQVDAIGCSTTVAAQINKRQPGAFEPKFVLKQQEMAVAMRPGQDHLLKAVNDFVAKNTANGELNKLYQKWLGADLPKMQ